jgi:hypothetical protein
VVRWGLLLHDKSDAPYLLSSAAMISTISMVLGGGCSR